MARRLRSVDLDFLNTAPVRLVFAATVAAPPAAVHHALAQDTEGWTSWFDAVKRARPTRAGRDITLVGGIFFEETVLASGEPKVYAYRVDTTNAPGLTALLEEWLLEPDTGGGTRVQWTFAADGPAPLRIASRLLRPGLGRAFRGAVRALDQRLSGGTAAAS